MISMKLFLENGTSIEVQNNLIRIETEMNNVFINEELVDENAYKQSKMYLDNKDSFFILNNNVYVTSTLTKVIVNGNVVFQSIFQANVPESFRHFAGSAQSVTKRTDDESIVEVVFDNCELTYTICTPSAKTEDAAYVFMFEKPTYLKNSLCFQDIQETDTHLIFKKKQFDLNDFLHLLNYVNDLFANTRGKKENYTA